MALDTLSIPAMSVECERVFSSTKEKITSSRNRLQEDIIEATECLKAWWDEDVTRQWDGRRRDVLAREAFYSGSQDIYNTLLSLVPSLPGSPGALLSLQPNPTMAGLLLTALVRA